jgi:hypothetical protein
MREAQVISVRQVVPTSAEEEPHVDGTAALFAA